MLLALLAGCLSAPLDPLNRGPFFTPVNFRGSKSWPSDVRRVAVLPLDAHGAALPEDFVSSLDPVWLAALQDTQRAEFVPVSRYQLSRLFSGTRSLDSTGLLPEHFLQRVAGATGADAVLFCDVTGSNPYAPMSIGLRTKLVHLRSGSLIWACDERFDAREPAVANSARRFARDSGSARGDAVTAILQSPTAFAAYASSSVAATFPNR
ncbi:hypothetical protein AW736_16170 [Termitidicoccus mucosus]|uniref:Lipoprotein n=1 Tax=Termitidicoccus mucosus TaxID=1184151 RepID=A0A178IG08_9BACT|nr:hypothetical protein AW736_16170 [Opitutaceae bacterium TSB47]